MIAIVYIFFCLSLTEVIYIYSCETGTGVHLGGEGGGAHPLEIFFKFYKQKSKVKKKE